MILKTFESFNSDLNIIDKIVNLYFKSDVVTVNQKQTNGYVVTNDKISFGSSYSYNDIDPYYLMHEMGHFVTIVNKNRLLQSHYGLRYTTVHSYNDIEYPLPLSWNAIKNEVKAVAYQEVLANYIVGKFPLSKWIDSFYLMEDFINVPLINAFYEKENMKWYDNDTKEVIDYSEYKERKLKTIYEYYEKWKKENSSILNIEKFNTLWFERIKYVEENI